MGNEIELISDGDSLAVIGNTTDVERFLLSAGLEQTASKELDLHRLRPLAGAAGTAAQIGAEIAANSGRWVKLTAESAEAVKKFGLMPTKTPGVSHAMIGNSGDIKQWLQIAQAPTALLSGPVAFAAIATMMQQYAMQQQMDEIVDYLQEINGKVDDILRGQKDAVVADMIGVDLIIEEALHVRDEVGRVSEVTWSKVQATATTIARTQAYAIRQLDAIAEKLGKQAALGDIAKAAREAEPKVREWLTILARTFHLQDGIAVLELDRVFDASPEELDSHRRGLSTARQNRLEIMGGSTARLLMLMDEIVDKANSRVLFNPFDSPAAVRSSHQVATDVLGFRTQLGIQSAYDSTNAKRWGQAATEVRDKVLLSATDGVKAAGRFGTSTFDRATGAFRATRTGDDGTSGRPRATAAVENAGEAIKGAATGVAGTFGTLFQRKKNGTPALDE